MVRSEVIDCTRPIGELIEGMSLLQGKKDTVSVTLFLTRLKHFFVLGHVKVARVIAKAGFKVRQRRVARGKCRLTAGKLPVYKILGKLIKHPGGSRKSHEEISQMPIGVLVDRLIQLGTPRDGLCHEQWLNTVVHLLFFQDSKVDLLGKVKPKQKPDHVLSLLCMPKSPLLHYFGSPKAARLGRVRQFMKPLERDATLTFMMTELCAFGRVRSKRLGVEESKLAQLRSTGRANSTLGMHLALPSRGDDAFLDDDYGEFAGYSDRVAQDLAEELFPESHPQDRVPILVG